MWEQCKELQEEAPSDPGDRGRAPENKRVYNEYADPDGDPV